MIIAILSGFVLSLAAPVIHRLGRGAAGWLIALLPLGLTLYFAGFVSAVAAGQVLPFVYPWVPSMGINLSFYVDGLSLTFALLVSGIGTLVIIYAGGYLAGHDQLGRFYAYILIFMASMLGLVLADNIFTLFIFWELTSISSFLLIGFDHARVESRASAIQALLVTGGGGLALLAGLILLGQAGGSLELSALFDQGEAIQSSGLYLPILVLVLLGAFTKSAQFPFHFWLPNAMEAPAPVSTYLHSATMVKAGVYLLARLSPILGGTAAWEMTVTTFGAVTMLLGGYLAWQQTDLKRILAYSTVSALGTLVMLIGLSLPIAVEAAMVFLLVHSFYKGALFMAAGAVDHETGMRDVTQLGGLRRKMPFTFVAVALACLSMAGLPPLLGFVGKELIYEGTLEAHHTAWLLTTVAVLGNILLVVAAAIVTLQPFTGPLVSTPKKPHEAPPSMWLGPILLSGFSLAAGLLPGLLVGPVVSSASAGILAKPVELELALWHGLTPMLALSAVTLLGGAAVYFGRRAIRRVTQRFDVIATWGPEQGYHRTLNGLLTTAGLLTRLLQNGYLRYYLLMTLAATVGLVGYPLVMRHGLSGWPVLTEVLFHEIVLALVIVAGLLMAVTTGSRLAAVAALGVVGFGVALIFILFSAPDLAMTQFAIETLTVVLLVLVLYRLPRFSAFTDFGDRVRDAVVAIIAGSMMTILVLLATGSPAPSRLTPYFAENSYLKAKGHNVVNVILVDFRGFDTMGEITVLAVAGFGVYALLKLRPPKEADGPDADGVG